MYDKEYLSFPFLIYLTVFWLVTSYFLGFYKVYRHTRILRLLTIICKQFVIFILGYFAYFGIFREAEIIENQFYILAIIVSVISVVKLFNLFILKKYRSLGNNLRTTVVLGFDESAKNIIKIFKNKPDLGYKYLGFFSNKEYRNKEYLGSYKEVFKFVNKNEVDEIYCSLKGHTQEQIKKINKFTTDYNITLKLIPDAKELYSKNQSVEYYDDTLMVLNVKKLPFDNKENLYLKRIFDICFSILVCIFFLSWIVPIIWVLVKLESKGPLIFKQQREGLNGDKFTCFKFRSMKLNSDADKIQATKNDIRVTKIGAILRKTSLDELPQFVNVLLGDMSVVGPRPHIESLSLEYQKDVDDYLKRHTVKPGITGLAQVSGYRGEVKKRSDIKNRVRFDIFYIENWSFFLDIKIIIKTMLNVFKGEEKAY
jgi:putative colanic acid biosynthesis UDP-glucose lipid carrier transferase